MANEEYPKILVAKAWEGAIDRKAYARSSFAAFNDYLIQCKVGDVSNPYTQQALNIIDLAKNVVEHLEENGHGEASIEDAARFIENEIQNVPEDKRSFLNEAEIIFAQYGDFREDEHEQRADRPVSKKRQRVPALV